MSARRRTGKKTKQSIFLTISLILASCSAAGESEPSLDGAELTSLSDPETQLVIPLSLYIVRDDTAQPESPRNSTRTLAGLEEVAEGIQTIWSDAGITFDPIVIDSIAVPSEVLDGVLAGDARPFLAQAGASFLVPNVGSINGFYVASAGGANGFTPIGSRAFFVTDHPSVHDERVSSHEIGHILGLHHVLDDEDRLLSSGTNGMMLVSSEIAVARYNAEQLIGDIDRVIIPNQGGPLEGHTPQGFAGSGTGLFIGDNLNPRFPEGEGVQIFLDFALPPNLETPSRVTLRSDALHLSGTPFADLGELQAVSVRFDRFGPELFDRSPDGDPVACERVGDHALTCDVTDAVRADIDGGNSSSQFRLRFTIAGDGDGSQDMALFYLSDSNTNEAGIFQLELER